VVNFLTVIVSGANATSELCSQNSLRSFKGVYILYYRLNAISDFVMAYIKEKHFCAQLCFNSATRTSKTNEIPESAYVEIVMGEHRFLSDFLGSNWVKSLLKTVSL
jgi:hypothetical protein